MFVCVCVVNIFFTIISFHSLSLSMTLCLYILTSLLGVLYSLVIKQINNWLLIMFHLVCLHCFILLCVYFSFSPHFFSPALSFSLSLSLCFSMYIIALVLYFDYICLLLLIICYGLFLLTYLLTK